MVAANPLRGEAALDADGESYTLTFDINALILAEEASGLDIDKLLDRLERGASLKVLRATIWAGLQRHHECHLIQAGEIMQAAGVKAARAAMLQGIGAAFPTAAKDAVENPPPAANGTGGDGSTAGAPKTA